MQKNQFKNINENKRLINLFKNIGFVVDSYFNDQFIFIRKKGFQKVILISGGKKYFKIYGFYKNYDSSQLSMLVKDRLNNIEKPKVLSKIFEIYYNSDFYLSFDSSKTYIDYIQEKKVIGNVKIFSLKQFKNNLFQFTKIDNSKSSDLYITETIFKEHLISIESSSNQYKFFIDIHKFANKQLYKDLHDENPFYFIDKQMIKFGIDSTKILNPVITNLNDIEKNQLHKQDIMKNFDIKIDNFNKLLEYLVKYQKQYFGKGV
jgi:hypothetical protein